MEETGHNAPFEEPVQAAMEEPAHFTYLEEAAPIASKEEPAPIAAVEEPAYIRFLKEPAHLAAIEEPARIATEQSEPERPLFELGAVAWSDIFPDTERKPAASSTPPQSNSRETRTYKGAIYEKGEDGQWHLQQK